MIRKSRGEITTVTAKIIKIVQIIKKKATITDVIRD